MTDIIAKAEAALVEAAEWRAKNGIVEINPGLVPDLIAHARAQEAEIARLQNLLCLADEVAMTMHGCFPAARTNERQIFLNDACKLIRAETGEDYHIRKASARAALTEASHER